MASVMMCPCEVRRTWLTAHTRVLMSGGTLTLSSGASFPFSPALAPAGGRPTRASRTRAGVIRAVVDGVVGNGLDVNSVSSEFDLRDRIASRFKRRGLKAAAFRHLQRES